MSDSPARPLVLVAEDYVDTRELLAEYLAYSGFEVITASRGPEAIEACAGSRVPEAVVLDIGMPGLDGLEVARRLRADPRTASIAIVACTGHGTEGEQEAARAAGCDEVLVKPVVPQLVADTLRRRLGIGTPSGARPRFRRR